MPPSSVRVAIAEDVEILRTHIAPLPMDDPRRRTWMYWPREMTDDSYSGLSLSDLDVDGRSAVLHLLGRFLDHDGLAQIAAVMALEIPLDQMEDRRTGLRAMDRYWLALFGDPPSGAWGFQFEGHHVSVNATMSGEAVASTTPLFLGANPAVVRRGSDIVSRPCGPEEDRARRLLASIGAHDEVLLSAEAPADIVTVRRPELEPTMRMGEPPHPLGGPMAALGALSPGDQQRLRIELEEPAGIARGDMPPSARALLDDLVSCYLERFQDWLAAEHRARIDDADIDAVHFAWAGSSEPGHPHYYRIHGPTMLVEYDCVQDGANHVHTVLRDPGRDFGLDPLRTHRMRAHVVRSR